MKFFNFWCFLAAFAFAKQSIKFTAPEKNQIVSVFESLDSNSIPFELVNTDKIDYEKTFIGLYRYRWYWSSMVESQQLTADMNAFETSRKLKSGKYFLKLYVKGMFKKHTIVKSPVFTIKSSEKMSYADALKRKSSVKKEQKTEEQVNQSSDDQEAKAPVETESPEENQAPSEVIAPVIPKENAKKNDDGFIKVESKKRKKTYAQALKKPILPKEDSEEEEDNVYGIPLSKNPFDVLADEGYESDSDDTFVQTKEMPAPVAPSYPSAPEVDDEGFTKVKSRYRPVYPVVSKIPTTKNPFDILAEDGETEADEEENVEPVKQAAAESEVDEVPNYYHDIFNDEQGAPETETDEEPNYYHDIFNDEHETPKAKVEEEPNYYHDIFNDEQVAQKDENEEEPNYYHDIFNDDQVASKAEDEEEPNYYHDIFNDEQVAQKDDEEEPNYYYDNFSDEKEVSKDEEEPNYYHEIFNEEQKAPKDEDEPNYYHDIFNDEPVSEEEEPNYYHDIFNDEVIEPELLPEDIVSEPEEIISKPVLKEMPKEELKPKPVVAPKPVQDFRKPGMSYADALKKPVMRQTPPPKPQMMILGNKKQNSRAY